MTFDVLFLNAKFIVFVYMTFYKYQKYDIYIANSEHLLFHFNQFMLFYSLLYFGDSIIRLLDMEILSETFKSCILVTSIGPDILSHFLLVLKKV
jgi:hypothetical protein